MKTEVRKGWKRIVALLLVMVMVVSMAPIEAKAANTVNFVKLKSKGVGKRFQYVETNITPSKLVNWMLFDGYYLVNVHYIKYWYGYDLVDSRDASPAQNYTAWQKMSTTDKRAITKWFAGFNSELKEQFGGGSVEMLRFANENSGWKASWSTFRTRLADKYYPEYANLWGDVDNNSGVAPSTSQFSTKLSSISTEYSSEEKEELSDKLNEYNVLWQEGRMPYRALVKLKEAQTNVAVTSISSDLIQYIADNLIISNPLYSGPSKLLECAGFSKTVQELLPAINDFQLSVQKYLGIYQETLAEQAWNRLSGQDQRIDSKAAAKQIQAYWDLIKIREKEVDIYYKACMKLKNELAEELDVAIADDEARAKLAEEQAAAVEAAHKEAWDQGVQYSVIIPNIYVLRESDENGELESEDEYHARQREAARAWAYSEYEKALDGAEQLMAENLNELNDMYENIDKNADSGSGTLTYTYARDEAYYIIYDQATLQTYLDKVNGFENLTPENLFKYCDYIQGSEAVVESLNKGISWPTDLQSRYEQALPNIKEKVISFQTDMQAYRNRIYSLCNGYSAEYGNWGLGNSSWEMADGLFWTNLTKAESIQANTEAIINTAKKEIEDNNDYITQFMADKANFEKSLKTVYANYKDTQEAMEYAMKEEIKAADNLMQLQDSYPDWLMYPEQDESDYIYDTSYDEEGNEQKYIHIPRNTYHSSVIEYETVEGYIGADSIYGLDVRPGAEQLYKEVFKDIDTGDVEKNAEWRKKVSDILEIIRGDADEEEYYMDQMIQARSILRYVVDCRGTEMSGTEIDNINKLNLGSVKLKNYVELAEDNGYAEYGKRQIIKSPAPNYTNDGKVIGNTYYPKCLEANLETGECYEMDQLRELFLEMSDKKGDFLRAAKSGDDAGIQEYAAYRNRLSEIPEYDENYQPTGKIKDYCLVDNDLGNQHYFSSSSYTPWLLADYYKENIKPIFDEVDKILHKNGKYVEVTGLNANDINVFSGAKVYSNSPMIEEELHTKEDTYSDDMLSALDNAEIKEDSIDVRNDASGDGDETENDGADESVDDPTVNIPESVTAREPDVILEMNGQAQLTATVVPADATYKDIFWVTTDDEVVSVDEDGLITGTGPGTAYIIATALDSPSESPIRIYYKVGVVSEEGFESIESVVDDMNEQEEDFRLISPSLSLTGKRASFTGALVYAGEEYYPPVKIVSALYDGDRYIGSSVISESLMSGNSVNLNAVVNMNTFIENDLNVKVYLVVDNSNVFIAGYSPLGVKNEDVSKGTNESGSGTGIYNLSVTQDEEGTTYTTKDVETAKKIALSVLDNSDMKIEPDNVTAGDKTYNSAYEAPCKISVTYSDAVKDSEYMITVLSGDGTMTAGNMSYIEQKKAEDSTVTFDIYPERFVTGDYQIYLCSDEAGGLDTVCRIAGYSVYELSDEQEQELNNLSTFTLDKKVSGQTDTEIVIEGKIELADNIQASAEMLKKEADAITWISNDQDIVADDDISCTCDALYGNRSAELKISFTPKKKGDVIITGTTANELTASCSVTVKEAENNGNEENDEETYTITYNLEGGTLEQINPVSYTDKTETFTLNNPEKTGYRFTGWTGSNGDVPQIEVRIEKGTTGDLSFVANWEENESGGGEQGGEEHGGEEVTYTISYELNGGVLDTPNPATYTVNTDTFILNNPTRQGYIFAGWSTQDNDMPSITITVQKGTMGNLVFTANWNKNNSEVGDTDGGNETGGSDGNGSHENGSHESGSSENGSSGNNNGKDGGTAGGNDGSNTGNNDAAPKTGAISEDKSGNAEYKVTAVDKESGLPEVSYMSSKESGKTSVTIPSSVTLADGTTATVTSISSGAFKGNKKLTAVNIPNTVVSIGDNAFKSCTKLKKVVIPKDVTNVGKNAFAGCSSLTKVTFKGTKITTIGDGVFSNCKKLTSIVIPKGVKKIGKETFKNCTKLTKITVKSTTISSIGKNAFKGVPGKAKASVPKKQKKTYQTKFKKAGFKGKVK